MMLQSQSQPGLTQSTLANLLWPTQAGSNGYARYVTLAVVGSLLLIASAKVQVPFWPVPMTMQTFAVLVIGMSFGSRLGAATVALYLIEGAVGLPVFAGTPAKGIGLAYMVGTTGGYLLGFLVAAYVVGLLAERGWDRKIYSAAAAMTLGTVIILALGVAWLGTIIGMQKAVEFGLMPFVVGAVFKVALATAVMPLAWRHFGGRDE